MHNGIDPGHLRHRITLQRINPTSSIGPTGDDITTWDTVGTYYAGVRSLTGREAFNAKQLVSQATHNITMRVIGPITSQDRFIFQGRVFGISAVMREDEVNERYDIIAYEKVGETP